MCEDFFLKKFLPTVWVMGGSGKVGIETGGFCRPGGRGCAKRGLRQGSPFRISYLQIRLMM